MALFLYTTAAFAGLLGLVCGGIRESIAFWSREFWLPKCPFCWAFRVLLVAGIAVHATVGA